MSIKDFYERIYSKRSNSYAFEDQPTYFLVDLVNSGDIGGRKVVDLGSGDGRNSIFLALHGFDVLAIDNSPESLKALGRFAKKKHVLGKIKTVKKPLGKISLKKNSLDLSVCTYVVHEIGEVATKHIINQVGKSLKIGRLAFFSIFLPKKGTYLRSECFYPTEKEFLSFFKGFKLLALNKSIVHQNHITPKSPEKKVSHKHLVLDVLFEKTR